VWKGSEIISPCDSDARDLDACWKLENYYAIRVDKLFFMMMGDLLRICGLSVSSFLGAASEGKG